MSLTTNWDKAYDPLIQLMKVLWTLDLLDINKFDLTDTEIKNILRDAYMKQGYYR